jgi:hypothetical protein
VSSYFLFGEKAVGSLPGAYQIAKTAGVVASSAEFERFDKHQAIKRRQRSALHASEAAIVGLLREPDRLGAGSFHNAFPNSMPTREVLTDSHDISAEIGQIIVAQDAVVELESFELLSAAELLGSVSVGFMATQ